MPVHFKAVFELGVVLGLNLRGSPAFTAGFNPTYLFRCFVGAIMLQILQLERKLRGIKGVTQGVSSGGLEKNIQEENIFHFST